MAFRIQLHSHQKKLTQQSCPILCPIPITSQYLSSLTTIAIRISTFLNSSSQLRQRQILSTQTYRHRSPYKGEFRQSSTCTYSFLLCSLILVGETSLPHSTLVMFSTHRTDTCQSPIHLYESLSTLLSHRRYNSIIVIQRESF